MLNILKLAQIFEEFSYRVGHSDIHGQGVFAKKDFGNGEEIQLALKLDKITPDSVQYNRTIFAKMTNHQNIPNMYLKKIGNDFWFCAKKYIKSGEELTTNYKEYDKLIERESAAYEKSIRVI